MIARWLIACVGHAAACGLLLVAPLPGAVADQTRLLTLDAARARGALVDIDSSQAPGCRADVVASANHSAIFELSCPASGGGSRMVTFVAFARIILNPEWSIESVDFVRLPDGSGGAYHAIRVPIAGTRNPWTELQLAAAPGGRVRVAAQLKVVSEAPPPLTCGSNPSWQLRAPQELPPAPPPGPDDKPFRCTSDSDCASGWRCDLRCGGVCDRR